MSDSSDEPAALPEGEPDNGATAREDPLPKHLELMAEKTVLGGSTGRQIVRCELCLNTQPVEEWQMLTHETDCKHPIESYETAGGEFVVQALTTSSGEWVSTTTPVEAVDAPTVVPCPDEDLPRGVSWDDVRTELGDE